jgi:hypothetical protein
MERKTSIASSSEPIQWPIVLDPKQAAEFVADSYAEDVPSEETPADFVKREGERLLARFLEKRARRPEFLDGDRSGR